MLKLSEKQQNFLAYSDHSFNIAVGAVSSGKTYIQTLRWIDFVGNDVPNGSLLMMTGKTHQSIYDNVIRDLIKLDNHFVASGAQNMITSLYYPKKNIEIRVATADNQKSWGRIQGKTVFGWLGDEVTQYPRNFIRMAISRCRGQGKTWPKFWTCNPDHPKHFILEDYIKNNDLDVKTWSFLMDDNPILSEEYKAEQRASFSGVYYDRMIKGLWVAAEGIVYEGFVEDVHVLDKFDLPAEWERFRAIDFGFTNPFVCLWGAVDNDGRIYIYDEHYQAKKLIKEHVVKIGEKDGSYSDKFGSVPKMNRSYSDTVADHDSQDRAELKDQGIHTNPAKKDITLGLQKVSSRLKIQKDGKPRLFISRRCANLISEIYSYHWPASKNQSNEKEVPEKVDDHAMDALRYMVMRIDRPSISGADISADSLGF